MPATSAASAAGGGSFHHPIQGLAGRKILTQVKQRYLAGCKRGRDSPKSAVRAGLNTLGFTKFPLTIQMPRTSQGSGRARKSACTRAPTAPDHGHSEERYVRLRDGTAGARPGRSRRSRLSRPVTADHGRSRQVTAGHGWSRRSRPVMAVTAGHDRAFWTRGHCPGVTPANQARTPRVRVRTAPSGPDLSTAVMAVVAAAVPGSGAPGAAPTRSSARWRVNGGGNHQGWRAGQTKRTREPARIMSRMLLFFVEYLVQIPEVPAGRFAISGFLLRPRIVTALP